MTINWSDYLNVEEVETVVANLANTHPDLARLVNLPEVSIEGRQCHALWLGSGDASDKDVAMVIGGVHGLEWGSCEIALNFAIDVLGSARNVLPLQYGTKTYPAAQVQAMLDQIHIVVFPLVNPDGRHHSQRVNPIWRRNRNPHYVARDAVGAGGVDLNRNFDFLFNHQAAFAADSGVSGTSDPHSHFYCGPHPFSEPETRNVRWLLDTFARTRWFVDLHACGERSVMHSWGDDEAQDQVPSMRFDNRAFDGQRGLPGDGYGEYMSSSDMNDFATLADVAATTINQASGLACTTKPSYQLYPTFGTSHDYAYARHIADPSKAKTLAFLLEWGSDPHPDWSIMEVAMRGVSAGLIALFAAAAAAGP